MILELATQPFIRLQVKYYEIVPEIISKGHHDQYS